MSGLYPQGTFKATPTELAAMHEADAAMRVSNFARFVIDNHAETEEGRTARLTFLSKLEQKHGKPLRAAVEAQAREYWRQTRKSKPRATEAT